MDGCQSVSKKGSPKLQSLAWAGSLYLSLGWLCLLLGRWLYWGFEIECKYKIHQGNT